MFANKHIFLTGFMGSGKSLLGKKLAVLFNIGFIDLDGYIEQREQKTIAHIFENSGEVAFREVESRCLLEICNAIPGSVVALGGGTVCFDNNLALVKQKGLLVYIELSAAALAERLKKNKQNRPLLTDMPENEMFQRIGVLLTQRKVFYEQAHLIVNGINLTSPLLYEKIREAERENTF